MRDSIRDNTVIIYIFKKTYTMKLLLGAHLCTSVAAQSLELLVGASATFYISRFASVIASRVSYLLAELVVIIGQWQILK